MSLLMTIGNDLFWSLHETEIKGAPSCLHKWTKICCNIK
jgi:hypothetical protein